MGSLFPLDSTGVLSFLALLSLFLLWRDLGRRLRRRFGFCPRGLSSVASLSSPLFSLDVSTVYISYDEVVVQRPVGGGSRSSPASSSILSMSCVQSQACRLSHRQWLLSGWWVGNEFLRRPLPTRARHSSAKRLLTRREILVNLARRPRVSAERYQWR
mgnify:CR=1 FL=1